ncbi:related to pre-rRNA processing protein Utp22 [Rhynchosporium agropyri]|uniref:U3 small nucleolar RNA-associated protein 22 n=1 Tax=Rhynchosporium agropyri TaxID=914238 RepID=A0A1E1KAR8_9HELO|nr:related to pre-rRNA processing protein Utp22 [Rhynchosporium agropyri]
MAPLSTKRRKLDNGRSVSPSENEAADIEQAQSQKLEVKSAQTAAQTRPKRADDDESSIYAGSLSKSSLFKLQVDELLSEVQPNYEKRLKGVDDLLHKLKGQIEGIAKRDAVSVPQASKILLKSHKIKIPYPDPKPDNSAAYKLSYQKPTNVNVVGSYASKTMVKSDSVLSVDMVVVMPVTIFTEKDYLNYRYFYKRAYYLACIADGLYDSISQYFTLSFEYLHGNTLHPIIVAKPISTSKSITEPKYQIRIIPAAPSTFFNKAKLQPGKNAVRPKDASETESPAQLSTPFYNASLISDCSFEPYLRYLHSSAKLAPGFKDSCILGQVWLRQRGFGGDVATGGFGHFEWAALTALLLKGGGPKGHNFLSPGYSSYQMFKAVLQFLASSDLAAKPVIFEAGDLKFSKEDTPILFDGLRGMNTLYKMTPWSYQLLRHEAKISLAMLNDSTFDQFESTFIIKSSQNLQRFDSTIRIAYSPHVLHNLSCDHVSSYRLFSSKVYDVLREGLMDRVGIIHLQEPDVPSWSVQSDGYPQQEAALQVSVVYDPANIDRLVDHGPAAEEKKKAAKFQNFWGDKAELRRFKDGSILESLIWPPGSAHAIFQDIVTYLVNRHVGQNSSESLVFIGDGFDKILPGSGLNTKHFDSLGEAYRVFEQRMRDLEELPLQLRQLSATSPQLRYSSIEPPLFSSSHPMKIPADILIQFEGSGRWPDDILAIQRTKIAFLLKIGSLLQDRSITTRVGLENEELPLHNCAFLDIIYDSGVVFRLRIHHDREQTLLERQVKDKSIDHHAREAAVSALSVYKKTFIHLPLHTQSIATHCTRFPLLSPTIRLTKLWFDKYMLLGHVSEELVEILVARTFLQPYPWQAPSSVMTGFLRTLLFISRWDWRVSPLIVDFTGTMTSSEVDSINTRLEAWRKIDPSMSRTVIFAASNHDHTGTGFTDKGPSKMVASRMTALARSACKMVKDKATDLEPKSLFAASTSDYDFVIHISPVFIGERRKGEKSKFKNIELQEKADLVLTGYQPLQLYIEEIQKLYTNTIVFFNGASATSTIGGLWNPLYVAPRAFKVNSTFATKVVNSEVGDLEKVVLDKNAILAEIARLGGDMISRIEVHR